LVRALLTVKSFSAAILGLPKLLKEEDLHTEFPSDTDDEYVTEKGFQPSLPGEATRLSNALALFRGARILGKVLEKIYPSATSHDLSLQQMSALGTELDDWYEKLPQHLKLTFKQDKPSTDITGSRSPILALAYYYTRTLIYRPAVTSSLGPKAASARIAVSESSKHIIQIIQLLEERSMSFAFCLNKADTLVLCGMVLLYQTMDLKQDSKMLRDNEKLVNEVIKAADKEKAPGCYDFKRVAGMLITVDEAPPQSLPTPPRQSPDACLAAPPAQRTSATGAHKAHQTLGRHLAASMSETDLLLQQEKLRRMTMPHHHHQNRPEHHPPQRSRGSFDCPRPTVPLAQRDHRLSLSQAHAAQAAMLGRLSMSPNAKHQTMEYYHLDSHSQPSPSSPVQNRGQQQHPQAQAHLYNQLQKGSGATTAEWEALLGSIEGGQLNVYDAIYGGPGLSITDTVSLATPVSTTTSHATAGANWSPDSWDLSGFNLGDFGPGAGTGSEHSAVSLSEDGLSSSDDLVSVGSAMDFSVDVRRGMMGQQHVGVATGDGGYVMDGLDNRYAL
jgi:hypothetical protein